MHLLAVGCTQTECISFTDNKSSLFYKKQVDGQTDRQTNSNFINIDVQLWFLEMHAWDQIEWLIIYISTEIVIINFVMCLSWYVLMEFRF